MTSRRLSVGVVAGFEQADAIGHVDDWLVDRGGHARLRLHSHRGTVAATSGRIFNRWGAPPHTRRATWWTWLARYLREEQLLPHLDEWLSRKFDPIALPSGHRQNSLTSSSVRALGCVRVLVLLLLPSAARW